MPLVYNGLTPDRPILTVVNYMKWYVLYLVNPDTSVVPVSQRVYEAVEDPNWEPPAGVDASQYDDLEYPRFAPNCWFDHIPNPGQLDRIAAQLGAVWDDNSVDMIVGRYEREIAK